MKKTKSVLLRLLLFLVLPLALIAFAIYLIFFNTIHVNSVKVSGNTIYNSYNNAVANWDHNSHSVLARIDDKLYYSYEPVDRFKAGTYEISNNFTKKIYVGGTYLSPEVLNLDVVGSNKLLLNRSNGKVDYYDFESGSYKSFVELDDKAVNDKAYSEVFYVNGKQYWYSGNEPFGIITSYEIYSSENNELKLYFSTEKIEESSVFCAPCFDGDYIYCASFENDTNTSANYLYKYNAKRGEVENKVKISEIGGYMIAGVDKVYSMIYAEEGKNKNRLTVTDINTQNQKSIFSTDGSSIVNGYNGLVCMGIYGDTDDKNGLYVIDGKTDEVKQIYSEKEVFGVYIVDDKWIYFSDEDDRLHRITPDGKTLEKVFG